MRWLRKERDLIGLVMVWGLLLQSLVIPVSARAHATARASGLDALGILCTSRDSSSVPVGTFAPDPQKQSNNGPDCQCCHMACRQGCGGICGGGILPTFVRVLLPSKTALADRSRSVEVLALDSASLAEGHPRAPPLA